MKECTSCGLLKNTDAFFLRNVSKNKLHRQCKACYKVKRASTYPLHYKNKGDAYRKYAVSAQQKRRIEYREKMREYLKEMRCKDCDESDPVVLEFDHLNPSEKSFTISQAVRLNKSWQDVLHEIKKCEIVCSNCHKKRTAKQFNWYKNQ